jgi:hypothetical protein
MNQHVAPKDFFDRVRGLNYAEVLRAIHAGLQPRNYFEIGTFTGGTLRLASCATIAVDPQFHIAGDVVGPRPMTMLFQMPSDEFFRRHSPSALFGETIDLAFLDGMHRFEYLLRDFLNTEKHCRRNSVVVMHDCLPGDALITARDMGDPRREGSRHPDYWAGDVWKLVPILRRWRPDLKIHVVDAAPTGLVFVTNLDPASTVLEKNYFEIVDAFMDVDLADYGVETLFSEIEIGRARDLVFADGYARHFWL